jgi:ADP-ribose pyrophosphatase YjhB (NUDIX family)
MNRILLLKRSNYTKAFPHHWTMPGGRWEAWENPEEIVVREVLEETSLSFNPDKLYFESEQENSWEMTHSHRFLWTWNGKIDIQEEEADWYAWYTYEETKNLKIAFDYSEVIEKLYNDWLIK